MHPNQENICRNSQELRPSTPGKANLAVALKNKKVVNSEAENNEAENNEIPLSPLKSPTSFPSDDFARAKSKVQGYHEQGNDSYRVNDYYTAMKFYKKALKWSYNMQEAARQGHEAQIRQRRSISYLSKSLSNVAKVHKNRQELTAARNYYNQAIEILMSPPLALQNDDPKIEKIKYSLKSIDVTEHNLQTSFEPLRIHAKTQENKGNYTKAMESYRFYLSKLQELVGGVNPMISDTLRKIGVMHWKLGDYNDALLVLSDSLRILVQCFGKSNPESAETLSSIGLVHLSRGEYSNAMKFYKVALRVKQETLGIHHPAVARIMIRIGMVYSEEGRLNKAMLMYRDGLEIQRSVLALQEEKDDDILDFSEESQIYSSPPLNCNSLRLEIAATLNSIGIVYEKKAEYSAAMDSYKEALSLYRSALGGDNHVDVAVTLNNCGQAHRHLGQYDRAMEVYRKSLKIMRSSLGESHRNVAATLQNIGVLHSIIGEFEKALELYKEALSIQRKSLGDDHPDVAVTLSDMGDLYEKQGDLELPKESLNRQPNSKWSNNDNYKKAASLFKRTLRIRRTAMGDDHYYVALTQHKLAVFLYNKMGYTEPALKRFKEVIRIYRINKVSQAEQHFVQAYGYLKQLEDEIIERRPHDSLGSTSFSEFSIHSSKTD